MIGQYHVSEQTRKREVDSALITAREVVERERREKLDVLSDRKSREEQYEQLTKSMTMLQVCSRLAAQWVGLKVCLLCKKKTGLKISNGHGHCRVIRLKTLG